MRRGVKRKRVERRGKERKSEEESIICSPQTISCTDNHEVDCKFLLMECAILSAEEMASEIIYAILKKRMSKTEGKYSQKM